MRTLAAFVATLSLVILIPTGAGATDWRWGTRSYDGGATGSRAPRYDHGHRQYDSGNRYDGYGRRDYGNGYRHHDWHGGTHYDVHEGTHWSPREGWHSGRHFGTHSGTHHDCHDSDHRFESPYRSGYYYKPALPLRWYR